MVRRALTLALVAAVAVALTAPLEAGGSPSCDRFKVAQVPPRIHGFPTRSRSVIDAKGIWRAGAAYHLLAPGVWLDGNTKYEVGKQMPCWRAAADARGMSFASAALKLRGTAVFYREVLVDGENDAVYLVDLESDDATHVFTGRAEPYDGWVFDGDPQYPLTFKKIRGLGWVYVCGRGTLTTGDAQPHRLGCDDTLDTWLPRLTSDDPLDREGAAQALGWLAKTQTETDQAVPALTAALTDDAMEVRRNAAEALGRIGDARGLDALTARSTAEKDDWVRDVVEESLGLIRVRNAAPKLPDDAPLAALSQGLKHKWPLVRQTAAGLLANAGSLAAELLITGLKDEDARVRATAATSLAVVGSATALEPLKQALAAEKDETAKKAMEEAVQRLGQYLAQEVKEVDTEGWLPAGGYTNLKGVVYTKYGPGGLILQHLTQWKPEVGDLHEVIVWAWPNKEHPPTGKVERTQRHAVLTDFAPWEEGPSFRVTFYGNLKADRRFAKAELNELCSPVLRDLKVSPTIWATPESVHVFRGTTAAFSGYEIVGDTDRPLAFRLAKDKGYIYLCGTGEVRYEGRVIFSARSPDDKRLLSELARGEPAQRQGAALALGYTQTNQEVVRALSAALTDSDATVRRYAGWSLSLHKQKDSLSAVQAALAAEKDPSVREALEEARDRIVPDAKQPGSQ